MAACVDLVGLRTRGPDPGNKVNLYLYHCVINSPSHVAEPDGIIARMKISLILQRSDVSRVAMTSVQCVTSAAPPRPPHTPPPAQVSVYFHCEQGRTPCRQEQWPSSRPEALSPGVLSETKMLEYLKAGAFLYFYDGLLESLLLFSARYMDPFRDALVISQIKRD